MDKEERLEAAKRAAREAGKMLRTYHNLHVENKAAKDYVTDADRASEKLIISMLRERFPNDGFYGEESGVSAPGDNMWVIDPIDGTTNFIKGLPIYTVSIAYVERGMPLVGVVYAPALDELFEATLGGGAFLNGRPIHVSDISEHDRALVIMSFVHRVPEVSRQVTALVCALLPEVDDMRRLGSAAYDLCSVACGRAEAFFEARLKLYDIAAGVLIVREAGGVATGWKGGADCLASGDVIASNGRVHEFFFNRLVLTP